MVLDWIGYVVCVLMYYIRCTVKTSQKTSQGTRDPKDIRSSDKTSKGQNVPRTKRPKGKNAPSNKMFQKTKNVLTGFSKTHVVLKFRNELNLWIGVILILERLG